MGLFDFLESTFLSYLYILSIGPLSDLGKIPELLSLAAYVSEDGLVGHQWKERQAHWSCKLYMPQYRGTPGPRTGSGWVGKWVGDFWGIALEM